MDVPLGLRPVWVSSFPLVNISGGDEKEYAAAGFGLPAAIREEKNGSASCGRLSQRLIPLLWRRPEV
jgi:hypothetical protein